MENIKEKSGKLLLKVKEIEQKVPQSVCLSVIGD